MFFKMDWPISLVISDFEQQVPTSAGLILGQRCRRWPNFGTNFELLQRQNPAPHPKVTLSFFLQPWDLHVYIKISPAVDAYNTAYIQNGTGF